MLHLSGEHEFSVPPLELPEINRLPDPEWLPGEAGLAPSAPATYPAGLTAREVQVLRLVAGGLSDAQVAEKLYVSPRTVGSHLYSIYNKLGVASRTAAARFATDHNLS